MDPQGSLIQSPGPAQDAPIIPACAYVCSPNASGALAGLAQAEDALFCRVRAGFQSHSIPSWEQQTEAVLL